jgi:protein transport protein SEC24
MPEMPVIDYGEDGPFRCQRCKAYVNVYMTFIEGGMKAECNLCKFINDVPVNYQSQLNEFGQRRDRLQRPEL